MLMILYAVIPAVTGLLILFSRKTTLPESLRETGLTGLFTRCALYLYERLPVGKLREKTAPLERSLRLLSPGTKGTDAGRDYFVKKMADTLMLLCAGSVLGAAIFLSARGKHVVDEDGRIARGAYMASDTTTELIALDEAGEELGAFDVPVSSRRYTAAEIDALFDEASDLLPTLILNGNASLGEVTGDLTFPDRIAGYPFLITWKSGDFGRVHSDGRIETKGLSPAGEMVKLTAQYVYEDTSFEQILYVCVMPETVDGETAKMQQMQELLVQADAATMEEAYLQLPDTFGEKAVTWKEIVKDNSSLVFLLMLIAAVAVFFAKDKEVKHRMEERKRQLLSDYPQFVSQLVLYLGAGMTMRSIVKRLAERYVKDRNNGKEMRFLQEELLRVTYVLSGGVAEENAYEQFGMRCGTQQYTRLCTLLTQNLKKGSNDLLRLLEEESGKAFAERLDLARKRGEEAGTKLLVPMMLLLGIVMIIIMIPAYAAF